jgi:hypothetical protein
MIRLTCTHSTRSENRATEEQKRAQEVNRLQKVLETANIKLAAVATDVMGKISQALSLLGRLVPR